MSSPDLAFFTSRSRMPAAARLLVALLRRVEAGSAELTGPDGATHVFGPGGAPAPNARATRAILEFRDWDVATEALKGGDVAFAESYMAGRWTTPDLTQLLTVLAANRSALERAFYGRWGTRMLLRLKHRLNANSKRQARRNILAHYDLGNAFYERWLDPGMTYSSALFDGDYALPLAVAQQAKYDRMLGELALRPGARILEIGCGWGGFAETAARAGHHVTGMSLSDAQTAYARARLAAAGLEAHTDLRV
jgi:cyclopropane-fatty-acyl-phospholipid synthase